MTRHFTQQTVQEGKEARSEAQSKITGARKCQSPRSLGVASRKPYTTPS